MLNCNEPSEIQALQKQIKELQIRNKQLEQDYQNQKITADQHTLELACLYQHVSGESPKDSWGTYDYAMALYYYLDSIIALVPGHIYWQDRNSVYLGCNDEHAKTAGLSSRHTIAGKTNTDMSWREKAHELNANNNRVMESGKTVIVEEHGKTVYGDQVFLSQKVPLRNKQGDVIGLLGMSVDITSQKKAIANLAYAKKKVEEASWAKSEFIQNMSHDLKTPLMTIMGMSELLSYSEENEERKKNLMMIHTAGKRMLEIFSSILDVANLEAGTVVVKKENVDLRDVINGLFELYQPLLQEKNLLLKIEVAENVPSQIMIDYMRIQRILLNLIGNALKFTSVGGVTVKANIDKATAQSYLILTVIDTGAGIPADKFELIFEKFVRLTSSYKGIHTGSGLGLSIVKRFTEELQGSIKVESDEEKGTVFTCRLPLI